LRRREKRDLLQPNGIKREREGAHSFNEQERGGWGGLRGKKRSKGKALILVVEGRKSFFTAGRRERNLHEWPKEGEREVVIGRGGFYIGAIRRENPSVSREAPWACCEKTLKGKR